MEYRTQVVPAKDLALLQAAIGLGGGTITHSKPHDNGDVAVTYVADDPIPVNRSASRSNGCAGSGLG